MNMKFSLYPIYRLADKECDDDRFEMSRLPLHIVNDVSIEDVSQLLHENAFAPFERLLGETRFKEAKRLKYVLIHRYDSDALDGERPIGDTEHEKRSANLLEALIACLRLIRPMCQMNLLFTNGDIREGGSLSIRKFSSTLLDGGVKVPGVQRLFTLRNSDADLFCELAPKFLHVSRGGFEKFHMAVDFYLHGYFQSDHWKPRFLLWCSAIESIYTSSNRDHQGANVAKQRIRWFLGDNTLLYKDEVADLYGIHPDIAIRDVLDNLYELRNFVAHGDRVPDTFFAPYPESILDQSPHKIDVLVETASFIIRKSLIKIMTEDLLRHFADASSAEAYFGAQGLTNSALKAKKSTTS